VWVWIDVYRKRKFLLKLNFSIIYYIYRSTPYNL